jgi:glycosyltransferase involved in cell wall biosynthesis
MNDQMQQTRPKVSLVICTRNRCQFLGAHFQALQSVKSQHAWEIIFVNNHSTDETQSILAAFARQSATPVRIVQEPSLGLGNARNAGWKLASAPIVAFTDDDCYPQPDMIDAIVDAFANTKLGYIGGRVMLYDPKDLPVTIKESTKTEHFPAYGYVGPGAIHGANFAIRAHLLKKIGGFDPLMGSGTPYPCEDCDALLRASYAGANGQYCPQVVVSHHHRRQSVDDLLKIETAYLAGRGAFFMKMLFRSSHPIQILYQWMRSAKHFGFKSWLKEIKFGLAYLNAVKSEKLNAHD